MPYNEPYPYNDPYPPSQDYRPPEYHRQERDYHDRRYERRRPPQPAYDDMANRVATGDIDYDLEVDQHPSKRRDSRSGRDGKPAPEDASQQKSIPIYHGEREAGEIDE